jgi:hypothetical protein
MAVMSIVPTKSRHGWQCYTLDSQHKVELHPGAEPRVTGRMVSLFNQIFSGFANRVGKACTRQWQVDLHL